jgi:hypothetical protein
MEKPFFEVGSRAAAQDQQCENLSACVYFVITLLMLIVCPDSSVMSPGFCPAGHAPTHLASIDEFCLEMFSIGGS